jgi:hypothetical protein
VLFRVRLHVLELALGPCNESCEARATLDVPVLASGAIASEVFSEFYTLNVPRVQILSKLLTTPSLQSKSRGGDGGAGRDADFGVA